MRRSCHCTTFRSVVEGAGWRDPFPTSTRPSNVWSCSSGSSREGCKPPSFLPAAFSPLPARGKMPIRTNRRKEVPKTRPKLQISRGKVPFSGFPIYPVFNTSSLSSRLAIGMLCWSFDLRHSSTSAKNKRLHTKANKQTTNILGVGRRE